MFSSKKLEKYWKTKEDPKGTKAVVDLGRIAGSKASSHFSGKGGDLRSFFSSKDGVKENILTTDIKQTYEAEGWSVVPPKTTSDKDKDKRRLKSGDEVVAVSDPKHKNNRLKDQYWMKMAKGKEVLYIELVSSPRHFHIHVDDGYLTAGSDKW